MLTHDDYYIALGRQRESQMSSEDQGLKWQQWDYVEGAQWEVLSDRVLQCSIFFQLINDAYRMTIC